MSTTRQLGVARTGDAQELPRLGRHSLGVTASSAAPRLLVVDDEPSIRDLLSASLRFAGYDVVTASDGSSALAQAEKHRPHLVVLDVMMPDMDGFEVTRKLRERGRDVRCCSSPPATTSRTR